MSTLQNRCVYDVAAKFYDLCYGAGTPVPVNDVPFYLELAQRTGGPGLELGCGTGRVGLELARAGYEVVGLDLSPHMLEIYRSKLAGESAEVRERVTLLEGDMADFELGRKFALILVPFRAFQHLLDAESQRECLKRVRAHLAEGGCFVFDAFNPDLAYIADAVERGRTWRYDVDTPYEEGGRLLRAFYANPNPGEQRHDLAFRYEQYGAGGQLVGTWFERHAMRWLYRYEAQYLLELCGLEIEAAYGSYDKAPLTGESRVLIYVCRGK